MNGFYPLLALLIAAVLFLLAHFSRGKKYSEFLRSFSIVVGSLAALLLFWWVALSLLLSGR